MAKLSSGNIFGNAVIPTWDDGNDPHYQNGFHVQINDGDPITYEELNALLRVDGAHNRELQEGLSEWGCATAVIDPTSGRAPRHSGALSASRWYLNGREPSIPPHTHPECPAYALHAKRGATRPMSTIVTSRYAFAKTLWEEMDSAIERLDDCAFAKMERYYENVIDPNVLAYREFSGGDYEFPQGGRWQYLQRLLTAQRAVQALPEHSKVEQDWLQNSEMGRVIIFDTRTALHCSGAIPEWCYRTRSIGNVYDWQLRIRSLLKKSTLTQYRLQDRNILKEDPSEEHLAEDELTLVG